MKRHLATNLFVTGTDTGIGKTFASVALLYAWRDAVCNLCGMKPVASGCETTVEGLRNEDALALLAAGPQVPYSSVNPFALRTPTAPEIAAAIDRVDIDLQPIETAFAALAAAHRPMLVEGVGGWLAPLSARWMQADLVRRLDLTVVLVVGLRLGCINHSLLSAQAIRADGLPLAGWIGNRIDPGFEHAEETIEILRQRLSPTPCLGVLPFAATREQAVAALQLEKLDV
jgi:dethiobiotin synthetase